MELNLNQVLNDFLEQSQNSVTNSFNQFSGSEIAPLNAPSFNQILDDPKLLVENKDLVINVYNQLKAKQVESRYQELLVTHQKNSKNFIDTLTAFITLWVDLALQLENQKDANRLNVTSEVLIGAVRFAAKTTYNSNINNVRESASELGSVLSRLFQEAQKREEIVDPIAPALNAANEAWTKATDAYVTFWNNQFKDVSDKFQIINMIRDAVVRASSSNNFPALLKKRADLESDVKELTKKFNKLLEEWTEKISPDRDNKFTKEMEDVRKSIKSKEAELKGVEDDLKSNQAAIRELLTSFGLTP